jgi:hypothetical protein
MFTSAGVVFNFEGTELLILGGMAGVVQNSVTGEMELEREMAQPFNVNTKAVIDPIQVAHDIPSFLPQW